MDTHSSAAECTNTGGYWVSGQVNQVSVNDNGTYNFGYSGTGPNGQLQSIAYNSYLAPSANSFFSLLSDGLAGFYDALSGRQPTTDGEMMAMNATRMLMMGMAGPEGEAEDVLGALETGAPDANKLFHIFGNPAHNLGDLVTKLGSKEAAYKAIQGATETAVRQQGLSGVFQVTVEVAGETITVRGNVINGAVKIGTAFK